MLHIIRQAYSSAAFERCLALLEAQDQLVLIEDAVYAMMRDDLRLQALQDEQRLYVVKADIDARGISVAGDLQIDYIGLVKLTEICTPIVTW